MFLCRKYRNNKGEKTLSSWPSVLGDSGICRNRIDPGSYFTMIQRRERRKKQKSSACVKFIQELLFEHLHTTEYILLCILRI